MSNPFRPIAISLLPNFSLADFFAQEIPAGKNVTYFETGRAAQYFLLKALNIGPGDEVIIQAFTCVAVPNSVLWTGAKPIYVDIDESLNVDPKKLEKAITKKTKAVIFQSTFGNRGQMEKVREICQKKNILFIEDGAHSGKVIYGLGFLSYGRDKAISGLYRGGAAIADFKIPAENLTRKNYSLFYPLIIFVILNTYTFFNLGKILHKLLKNFLPKVLTPEEKRGEKPEEFYAPPPVVLTKDNSNHQKEIADFYQNNFTGVYGILRFSILVNNPHGLRQFAAKQNVFLGDWYDQVVAPKGVDLEKVGYKPGSCPQAETISRRIVNLPTNISLEEAKKVIKIVKEYVG